MSREQSSDWGQTHRQATSGLAFPGRQNVLTPLAGPPGQARPGLRTARVLASGAPRAIIDLLVSPPRACERPRSERGLRLGFSHQAWGDL